MPAIQQLLFSDEQIVRSGKPQFLPYMANSLARGCLFSVIFFLPFFIVSFVLQQTLGEISGALTMVNNILTPFWILGLFCLVIVPLYALVVYPTIKYTLTSQRVLIQGGVIGNDLQAIDRKNITSSNVIIAIWDKLFGNNSGTLVFTTAMVMKPVVCKNISNPYEVFTLLKS